MTVPSCRGKGDAGNAADGNGIAMKEKPRKATRKR